MSLPLVLRDEARADFDEAFDWYNLQRTGLGTEFVAEVQAALDQIANNPLVHRMAFADIRKCVVRRFPYIVFYRAHTVLVEVIAVFHTSRDPSIWQRRA